MTLPFNLPSIDTSDFRAGFLPRVGGVNLAPHLVPLYEAKPGDLVGMVSSMNCSVKAFPSHEYGLEVFCVQGEDGLEIRFYDELAGEAAGHAADLVAEELFMGSDLSRIASVCNMVEHSEFHTLSTVHFADAILYINRAWLAGDLDLDFVDPAELRPVVVKMGEVSDRASAEACVAKTRRYLEFFRSMLPAHSRDDADWSIELPSPDVFLAPGARLRR